MSLESGCRERLLQSEDGRQAVTLLDAWERKVIELEQWRLAAGWREDGFGPQTPNEVAVFQRATEHVNGQVTGLEIAKLRAEVATANAALEEARAGIRVMLKENAEERAAHDKTRAELARLKTDLEFETDCLAATHRNGKAVCEQRDEIRSELETAQATAKEALQNLDDSEAELRTLKQQIRSCQRRADRSRRFAFLWKEHAKRLRTTARELEQEAQVATELVEQKNAVHKLLWETYEREQQAHAVYRESAEDCMQAIQAQCDQTAPILKACDACFHQCQGMLRYSTQESDQYWELAESLMELTSKWLEIPIERKTDPEDAVMKNDLVARVDHDVDRPQSSGSIPTDGSAPDPTGQVGDQAAGG